MRKVEAKEECLDSKQSFFKRIISSPYFPHVIIITGIVLSFFILDIGLRYFANEHVGFYAFSHLSPNLFSLSWIFLFGGIFYLFPKKIRKFLYPIVLTIFSVLTIAQILHMKILGRFFGFSDVLLTGEASNYFGFVFGRVDIYLVCLISIVIVIMSGTLFLIHKTDDLKRDKKYFSISIVIISLLFLGTRFCAVDRLGSSTSNPLSWESSMNPKNVYDEFNNQNKNIEVAGIYEQTIRNIYLYVKESLKEEDKETISYLNNYFKDTRNVEEKNEVTGMFEGKNVILILLESIDSWLVNEEVMPTFTKLQKEGWNFTNRYAPPFGGGQTINSEFAVNTGLYAVSNTKAIYNFDGNDFTYSLPNLFRNNGYSANSIHANTGNFYNRTNLHLSLGYENHYALKDMKNLDTKKYSYEKDTSLIKDDSVYRLIVPNQEEPFMSYVATYSAHVPYDSTNDRCTNNPYNLNVDGNTELSCIRNLARETDEMLKLLVERLAEDKKLDDTVLVLFTDHYAYGYSDTDYIKNKKNTDNLDLLQNVPFTIWSNTIDSKEISTVMDTADILPTVANLFNLETNSNNYIGTDVFSNSHENFVYFPDGSWYNGVRYYNGRDNSETVLKEFEEDNTQLIGSLVKEKMTINDLIIKSNYYHYKK